MKDVDEVYAAIQHQFPILIGSTDLPSHNIRFAIGNLKSYKGLGTCELCDVFLRFFKDRLPTAIDGKIGCHYSDIIEHCLDKVILYLAHSVRCKAQQRRIKELMSLSKGEVLVITLDYMMKWEEERARESSREHYGKRGISVHGSLVKYKLDDGSTYKKVYITCYIVCMS